MLYFTPTPIGNLADISYRAVELLKDCDAIICEDTRVCKSLINLLNERLKINIKPKSILALHTHNEKFFFNAIEKEFFEQNVLYMSDAGMPCISDPGLSLLLYAQEKQIAYEVLPGANAALTALVASGMCEKEFIFLGFLNNKGHIRQTQIQRLLLNPYVSIIYEAPTRILELIKSLAQIDPQRLIFAIKEISKKFEKKFKNTAQKLYEQLQDENLQGEWVLIVDKSLNQDFIQNTLTQNDILELDLPLKTKAKLIAKLNGQNPKALYNLLLKKEI